MQGPPLPSDKRGIYVDYVQSQSTYCWGSETAGERMLEEVRDSQRERSGFILALRQSLV